MVGPSLSRMPLMPCLIVFSHLRWNFVYQRPQHLLSRMALRWPVVFIEEPVTQAPQDRLERIDAAPGLQVWRPHVRGSAHGFHAEHQPVLQRLVQEQLKRQALTDYWLWFYTPMALPVAQALRPQGMVYDCMDELSLFHGAPKELVDQEAALLRKVDVVFTGGRSLFNAKRDRHPNVHCFPSSVDAAHFRRGHADHPLQRALARPRLGFCGVIDERIDLALVAGIAQRRPDWQVVMVGPVAKIDPAALPRRPNLHWLGQQAYQDLPAFINGWDVCLLPFALNPSTRFISPTKTLEYMACGRPMVSTAIRDVVDAYRQVVSIRPDADGFVQACDAILQRSPAQAQAHQQALAQIIARTSWDATAAAMADLIVQARGAAAARRADPVRHARVGGGPRTVALG